MTVTHHQRQVLNSPSKMLDLILKVTKGSSHLSEFRTHASSLGGEKIEKTSETECQQVGKGWMANEQIQNDRGRPKARAGQKSSPEQIQKGRTGSVRSALETHSRMDTPSPKS